MMAFIVEQKQNHKKMMKIWDGKELKLTSENNFIKLRQRKIQTINIILCSIHSFFFFSFFSISFCFFIFFKQSKLCIYFMACDIIAVIRPMVILSRFFILHYFIIRLILSFWFILFAHLFRRDYNVKMQPSVLWVWTA